MSEPGGAFDFTGGPVDPDPGAPPLLPTFEHREGREQRLQSDTYWRRLFYVDPVGRNRESAATIDGADRALARAWGITPQTVRARWRRGRTPRVGQPSRIVLTSTARRRWRYLGNAEWAVPRRRRTTVRTSMAAVRFLKDIGIWEQAGMWCIERRAPAGTRGTLMSANIRYLVYIGESR